MHTDIMYSLLLLTIFFSASGVFSSNFHVPCKVHDVSCMENFLNNLHKSVIIGVPELEIESSDPLLVEKIEANQSVLKYTLFDSTLDGYKSCVISNVRINDDITSLKYDLNCQKLALKGKYEMSGHLVALPVEGKGDYESIAEKYLIHVESILKKVEGADGKIHLAIEKNKLKCVPLDIITYKFENLFNGQKDLADAVHKFAAEHWRKVAEQVQDPIWYALENKITGKMNKYLKSIPLENIIQN